MKKALLISLLFALVPLQFISAKSITKNKPAKPSYKDEAKGAECRKAAEEFQLQQKNAEKNNDMTLAGALKKCADIKLQIAKGYETGDKNMIENGLHDFKKAIFERDEALLGEYQAEAKAAEAKGNKVLADILRRLASAKLKMIKARKTGDSKALDAATEETRKILAEKEKLNIEDLNKQLEKTEKDDKTEMAAALKKYIEAKQKLVKAYEANNGKMIDDASDECKKLLAEKNAASKGQKASGKK